MSDYAGYNELEQIYDDDGNIVNAPVKKLSKDEYESQCYQLRQSIKRNNQLVVMAVIFLSLLIVVKK